MNYRSVIYKMIKKSGPLFFSYNLYLSFDEIGLTKFINHCKDLAASIVEEGSAVPVTNSMLRIREALGLPMSRFDKVDVKKLATATRLLNSLEISE